MMEKYQAGVYSSLASSPTGQALWAFLNRPDNIVRMQTATALDRPALEGVEDGLLAEFGEQLNEDRTRQMIGHMARQIMEGLGYVVAVQNVKMTSGAPFSRATRYKRPDDVTFYAFKSSADPRQIALTFDKAGARLPSLSGGGHWVPWKSFRGGLRGRIAFGLDDEAAAKRDIATHGFHLYTLSRVLRAG